jgi:hypothetical protein
MYPGIDFQLWSFPNDTTFCSGPHFQVASGESVTHTHNAKKTEWTSRDATSKCDESSQAKKLEKLKKAGDRIRTDDVQFGKTPLGSRD